ncbi:hypothetical protein GLOIN_2v1787811 [Rhizophagus irregularis DAOM 181602=DAOM 197198]|nr:hypothetical protein GLOIN_2v1787811 [Rhizophagus irregularis DAOM 181602=DAOM 197198]
MMINVEKLKDVPEVYSDFLGIEKTTTLIRSPPGTWKTIALREIIMALKDKVHDISSLPCYIWISYRKSFNRSFVAILDEANAIMRQMSSGTNARESKNAMRDVLRFARHILAIDAFANISTLTFFQMYRGENIWIVDNKYQPHIRQGKRVAFVSTGAVMARALVEKASKSSKPDNSLIRACAYYGDMDKKRGGGNIIQGYKSLRYSFPGSALAQMLYQIRDCSRLIVSLFYQKNSNELFRPPGHENIRAELASARPNNLPIAIKGHRE